MRFKPAIRHSLIILMLAVCSGSFGQVSKVTISGVIRDNRSGAALPYVNVVLKNKSDSSFVAGTITGEDGRFTMTNVKPGEYVLEETYVGYNRGVQPLLIGKLSE